MCHANDFANNLPYLRRNQRPANANVADNGNPNPRRRRVTLIIPFRKLPGDIMKRWGAAIASGRVGLWSLALAVAVPISLHLAERTYLRPAQYRAEQFRLHGALLNPDWVTDLMLAFTNLAVSLSCRFTWAEGGGDIPRPNLAKLVGAYLGFIILGVAWDPIVLGLGAIELGLLASGARLGLQVAIALMLIEVDFDACLGVLACGIWSFSVLTTNVNLLQYGSVAYFLWGPMPWY